MDRAEAKLIAQQVLAEHLDGKTYEDLVPLVDHSLWVDRTAASGTPYVVELLGLWDDKPRGVLRVRSCAMDGSKGRLGFYRNEVVDALIDPRS